MENSCPQDVLKIKRVSLNSELFMFDFHSSCQSSPDKSGFCCWQMSLKHHQFLLWHMDFVQTWDLCFWKNNPAVLLDKRKYPQSTSSFFLL